jgi:hypothetical protein
MDDFVDSDDSDDVMDDEDERKKEGEKRGRKERREREKGQNSAPKIKNRAGEKRKASVHQDDLEMDSDEDDGGVPKAIRGSLGKMNRSMTPA